MDLFDQKISKTFLKQPSRTNKPKSRPTPKNRLKILDISILKAYLPKPQTRSPKRKRLPSTLNPTQASQKLSLNSLSNSLPNTKPFPISKAKLKEQKLDSMISSFLKDHHSTNLDPHIQLNFEAENEQKQYEKNLASYRGEDLANYQNDLDKNLKIEKIRQKIYKKVRLQSL